MPSVVTLGDNDKMRDINVRCDRSEMRADGPDDIGASWRGAFDPVITILRPVNLG